MKKNKHIRQRQEQELRKIRMSSDEGKTFQRKKSNCENFLAFDCLSEKQDLKSVMENNEQLKERIKQLQSENSILAKEKELLKSEFLAFMREAKRYQQLESRNGLDIERKSYEYFESIESIIRGNNALVEKENSYFQMIKALQSEIKLLSEVKLNYKNKYHQEKDLSMVRASKLALYKEELLKYEQRLEKEIDYNKKCQVQIAKLESQLQEALRDLQGLLEGEKKRDGNIEQIKSRYDRQIQRLKQRNDKYKAKAHQYKTQRNQLASQMERVKVEMGSIAMQKYYPEGREG